MLPMVGNVDEARHILKSMKYTPDGGRGVALQVAHDRYRPGPGHRQVRRRQPPQHVLLPDRDRGRRRERRRHRRAAGSRLPLGRPFRPFGFARRSGRVRLEDIHRRDRACLRRLPQARKVPRAPGPDGATGDRSFWPGLRLHLLFRRRLGAARRAQGRDRQIARRLRARRRSRRRRGSKR